MMNKMLMIAKDIGASDAEIEIMKKQIVPVGKGIPERSKNKPAGNDDAEDRVAEITYDTE